MPFSPVPGTLVFVHSHGLAGKAIRLGEWLRFRDGRFWNHVAIVSDQTCPCSSPRVIQAEGHGVTDTACLSTIAPGGQYEEVIVPDAWDEDILAFAKTQVGKKYGWLSIVSIAVQIILPRWLTLPSLRSESTWICSALAGESARVGGWLHDWPDIYRVVPSELYAAIHDISVRDVARSTN